MEDAADLTVLWWPPGTRYECMRMASRVDGLANLVRGEWELEDAEWWGGDCLLVMPTGAPYAIWPYRGPDQALIGWYCNLQAPLQRTTRGFDTDDWTLDIVAAPDLSSWMWKDEDELEAAVELGLYSTSDVARIRAAGDEMVQLIESRSPLFVEWAHWRPPEHWTPPSLPD